jgi:glucose-6-phosphate 1-dehydrogenase
MLIRDMIQQVILEILILTQMYPFKVDSQRIRIKIFD